MGQVGPRAAPHPRHDQGPSKRARKRPAMDYEDPEKEFKKQRRAARFQHGHPKKLRPEPLVLPIHNPEPPGAETPDWRELKILGTCQDVTKRYLRLTCAPDPATVRPVAVGGGSWGAGGGVGGWGGVLCGAGGGSGGVLWGFYGAVGLRGVLWGWGGLEGLSGAEGWLGVGGGCGGLGGFLWALCGAGGG